MRVLTSSENTNHSLAILISWVTERTYPSLLADVVCLVFVTCSDLDENLQRAFHKYLELRGITPMTTNFLHEYMINKDSREYLFWLNKLKDFVKL